MPYRTLAILQNSNQKPVPPISEVVAIRSSTGKSVMPAESNTVCLLCERTVVKVTAHHLKPKSRGGKATIGICQDCHGMIHALFPNKQLERELATVEELTSHPEFANYLKWVKGRPANRRFRARRSKKTRNRGRAG